MASLEKNDEIQNFKLILTCPVCLAYYRYPKQFPGCSHSLCLACMLPLDLKPIQMPHSLQFQPAVECPTCRAPSLLGPRGIYGFPDNVLAAQLVQAVEAQENIEKTKPGHFGDTCLHFVGLAGRQLCPHCNSTFCDVCSFAHAERLRLELSAMMNEENEIWRGLEPLERIIQTKSELFDRELKHVEAKLRSTVDILIDTARIVLMEKVSELLSVASAQNLEYLSQLEMTFKEKCSEALQNAMSFRNQQFAVTPDLTQGANFHKLMADRANDLKALRKQVKLDFAINKEVGNQLAQLIDGLHLGTTIQSNSDDDSIVPEIPETVFEQCVGEATSKPQVSTVKKISVLGICHIPNTQLVVLAMSNDKLRFVDISKTSRQAFQVYDCQGTRVDLSGPIVATERSRLFLLNASQRRILAIDLKVKSNNLVILSGTFDVTSSDSSMKGLAYLSDRKDVLTIIDDKMFAFDALSFESKWKIDVKPHAFLMAASVHWNGAVYYSSETKKFHLKMWNMGTCPQGLTKRENKGFTLDGIEVSNFQRGLDVDSKGRLVIIQGKTLKIYPSPSISKGIVQLEKTLVNDTTFLFSVNVNNTALQCFSHEDSDELHLIEI